MTAHDNVALLNPEIWAHLTAIKAILVALVETHPDKPALKKVLAEAKVAQRGLLAPTVLVGSQKELLAQVLDELVSGLRL